MFVGHGLLAFAVVGIIARHSGTSADRALVLAGVAALFATLPDVDILYGPVGLLGGISGLGDAVDTFWTTGNVVHRGPTHSLVIGALAATGFALAARTWLPARIASGGLLVGIVGITAAAGGGLDAIVTAVFLAGGIAIVVLARRVDIPARTIAPLALFGLLSHPFGDLLTGSPPGFLFPFDVVLLGERFAVHPDGTVHLLAAFGIELAIVWFACAVYFELTDRSIAGAVDRRVAPLGVLYGAAVLVLPAPTVHSATPFVLSVLSVGLVGALPTTRSVRPALPRIVATGLAGISLAATAFAAAYLLL